MTDRRILELVAALARDAETRGAISSELARYLEADDLLILVFENTHSSYLPPSGFPQTLYQSRRWKLFTNDVVANSSAVGSLCYPTADRERTARGWAAPDGSILTLFDGQPNQELVQSVLTLIPLIAPTFERERLIITSQAEAKLSAQAARQARDLAESLDRVQRQLQSTLMLREQDIAEREQIKGQLERSNSELKRVNDDLKQFTFAATHDIREPLRMITIHVQLLEQELAGQLSETGFEYINQVVLGAQRIARLIDGLLQFTRLGETQSIQATPVESKTVLQEALADLQVSIAENQARVISGDLPPVMADSLHLLQLFQNLVGNAIKYRRPDISPEIRISAEREGDSWLFSIQDNGIGIAPEYHDQIFVPFKRLHGSEIAGAGIGLATCKRIVERYGGRIWLESDGMRGSVFHFSLAAARSEQLANSY